MLFWSVCSVDIRNWARSGPAPASIVPVLGRPNAFIEPVFSTDIFLLRFIGHFEGQIKFAPKFIVLMIPESIRSIRILWHQTNIISGSVEWKRKGNNGMAHASPYVTRGAPLVVAPVPPHTTGIRFKRVVCGLNREVMCFRRCTPVNRYYFPRVTAYFQHVPTKSCTIFYAQFMLHSKFRIFFCVWFPT